MFKNLTTAADKNPELARELADLVASHAARLRSLAKKYRIDLEPAALDDGDLDQVGGGARPPSGRPLA